MRLIESTAKQCELKLDYIISKQDERRTDHLPLELRPVQMDDLQVAHSLWTNSNVRFFLFDDREISEDEARLLIEASLRSFEERGYGVWLAYSRETAALTGFAGFISSDDESPNLVYGVHPDFCGNGFATEAAKAVVEFGFKTLGLASIKADVDEPNVYSVRILENLGMRQVRRAIVGGRPLLYYELHRDDRIKFQGKSP